MGVPYIGFSKKTLDSRPLIGEGESITCPKCGMQHILEKFQDMHRNPSGILMFYRCGDANYLGAVNGRLIVGTEVDASGEI